MLHSSQIIKGQILTFDSWQEDAVGRMEESKNSSFEK